MKNNSINNNGNDDILFTAKVEHITPPSLECSEARYQLSIMTSNDRQWYKECSLNELSSFRNVLIYYFPNISNLPFPSKSLLSYLPLIGHKYDERNWDVLLENKFILDDFFNAICKDTQLYKLTIFEEFFEQPRETIRNSFFDVC